MHIHFTRKEDIRHTVYPAYKRSDGCRNHACIDRKVRQDNNIQVLEHWIAIDLITKGWLARRNNELPPIPDRILGAMLYTRKAKEFVHSQAQIVALCTGGAGKVYLYTSNPDIASGDGIAMAWRSGASVANMGFVQFHPTCLFHPKARNF